MSALAVVPLAVVALLVFGPKKTPEPPTPRPSPPVERAEVQSLAGLVRDEAGEPLENVEVSLPKLGAKAITDANGYFHLRISAEKQASVDFMARKAGYETYEDEATLGNTGLDFPMKKR